MVVGKYRKFISGFCFYLSADYGAFIVSDDVLFLNINIILKDNFKKLLNSLEFFLFNVRVKRAIAKLSKGYKNFISYFELCGRGTKTF